MVLNILIGIFLVVHLACALLCIFFWLLFFEHKKTTFLTHLLVIIGSLLGGTLFLVFMALIMFVLALITN